MAIGKNAVEILEAGYYVTVSGMRVDIRKQVDEAVLGTVSYPPDRDLPHKSPHLGAMFVEVRNITTFGGVEYLRSKGFESAALNFASATTAGGGFLNGARAQEEYLARSSALWACLRGNPMYSYHRVRQDPFYSDYVVYSPNVLVFRNDAGELLEAPYKCSIITSPAVHAYGVKRYVPARVGEISPVMWRRILKVLAVAERHGHKSLVLGAWGCGAFGNDGNDIARLFRKALEENFRGAFEHVLFAITDWSEDERYIGPFKRVFGGGQIQFQGMT
ncbi:MAG: TIGR02452 family protein [Candidatus Deferrimicrobium sp.]